jgi:hypothetical protein
LTHDAVVDADLVGQRAFGRLNFREFGWLRGVAYIDDRGAIWGLHMTDIGDPILHNYRASARTIKITNSPNALRDRHNYSRFDTNKTSAVLTIATKRAASQRESTLSGHLQRAAIASPTATQYK